MRLNVSSAASSSEVINASHILKERHPLSIDHEAKDGVIFKKSDVSSRAFRVFSQSGRLIVEYADLSSALRALGFLLGDTEIPEGGLEFASPFKTQGIMLDCSRNAVMKVEHFKLWLEKLSLLGFNMAMLYTEDTYKLPGESYWGYLRGAYSKEELKEIDTYANLLGIEMIPCIQALGHMGGVLKWPVYADITDTGNVMLVGSKQTEAIIERMLLFYSEAFSSRRIHIGMDETYGLGRGKYMDRGGRDGFVDLYFTHLEMVVKKCEELKLEPMLWSDMLFHSNLDLEAAQTRDGFYNPQAEIPERITSRIPESAQLVYWDYYHPNIDDYTARINKHRQMGFEPIMASAVWTWHELMYGKTFTEANALPCIQACKYKQVEEIFFTMWGDDGGYCDYDSAMAGLTFVASHCWNDNPSKQEIAMDFQSVCGEDYELLCQACELDIFESDESEFPPPRIWASSVLWDDPILGIYWRNEKLRSPDIWSKVLEYYFKLSQALEEHQNITREFQDIRHAWLLCKTLECKIRVRDKLTNSYPHDKAGLKSIACEIAETIEFLNMLDESWRRQWMRRNKPFGFEILQVRIAGLIRRYRELSARIDEYLAGAIQKLDELEEETPEMPINLPNGFCRIFSNSGF